MQSNKNSFENLPNKFSKKQKNSIQTKSFKKFSFLLVATQLLNHHQVQQNPLCAIVFFDIVEIMRCELWIRKKYLQQNGFIIFRDFDTTIFLNH